MASTKQSDETEGKKEIKSQSQAAIKEKLNVKKGIKHFRDLIVYLKAFDAAMRIFQITKTFPPEEKYSLIDQIRRSSRSVCLSFAFRFFLFIL